MNVIFLDFDGVLNHAKTEWRLNVRRARGGGIGEFFHLGGGGGLIGLDPENVTVLNAIMKRAPTANVVVSSSWRRSFPLDVLVEMLVEVGFAYPERIIDRTPAKLSSSRGQEIFLWLDDHQTENYVILDDTTSGMDTEMLQHLVKSSFTAGGLQKEHITPAILRLRGRSA